MQSQTPNWCYLEAKISKILHYTNWSYFVELPLILCTHIFCYLRRRDHVSTPRVSLRVWPTALWPYSYFIALPFYLLPSFVWLPFFFNLPANTHTHTTYSSYHSYNHMYAAIIKCVFCHMFWLCVKSVLSISSPIHRCMAIQALSSCACVAGYESLCVCTACITPTCTSTLH